jgi:hypothetical protein
MTAPPGGATLVTGQRVSEGATFDCLSKLAIGCWGNARSASTPRLAPAS